MFVRASMVRRKFEVSCTFPIKMHVISTFDRGGFPRWSLDKRSVSGRPSCRAHLAVIVESVEICPSTHQEVCLILSADVEQPLVAHSNMIDQSSPLNRTLFPPLALGMTINSREIHAT